MTLRKNIAAALRESAKVSISRVVASPANDEQTRRAANVAVIYMALADILDPNGHAPVARPDHHARGVGPAAPAGQRGGGIEQAARPAAADAKGGQGEQGSTAPTRQWLEDAAAQLGLWLVSVEIDASGPSLAGATRLTWVVERAGLRWTRHLNKAALVSGPLEAVLLDALRADAASLQASGRRSLRVVKGGSA